MYKEVPEDLQEKVKKAVHILNEHQCVVDTMLVAVDNKYYGYQPYPQPQKKPISKKLPQKRLKELNRAFDEAQKSLEKDHVELLVCFASLNEGGASVFVAQDAVDRRLDVFKELEKMEEHHAKIS